MANYPKAMTARAWARVDDRHQWTCSSDGCDNAAEHEHGRCRECRESIDGDDRYDRMVDEARL